MIDLSNAHVAIRIAGGSNVRIVPMEGQSVTDGDYQILVNKDQNWQPVVVGVKKIIAEQIVAQALNRVICG